LALEVDFTLRLGCARCRCLKERVPGLVRVGGGAVVLEIRPQRISVDLANDFWHGKGGSDAVLGGHVVCQTRGKASIGVVGRRDALLLNDDIVARGAVLEGAQDIGGDGRRVGDRGVGGGDEQAGGVSLSASSKLRHIAWRRTRQWRRGRRATCC
jgi:hypothetical protein